MNTFAETTKKGTPALTPPAYYDMIRAKNHAFHLRLAMVRHAQQHGLRDAARAFACARNTVRKWLRRYEESGRAGLADRSRAPRACPHKTAPSHEKKVLDARDTAPCLGPRRLKDLFGLKPSQGAIARILRQNGRAQKRTTRRKKKNDLRAIKALYRPFERVQADTKPLYDIAAYWPQMQALGLPRHQYTHCDVKSGALLIHYADELCAAYAVQASARIIEHLKKWNVDLSQVTFTTDNGSEYGGAERHERVHGYPAVIKARGVAHRFLPPRTPNAHANVESSHAMIERELFDLEPFRNRADFFEKVAAYQNWWNFARVNYSKGGKTPAQILEENGVNPAVLLLAPADLGCYLRTRSPTAAAGERVGHHLPALPG